MITGPVGADVIGLKERHGPISIPMTRLGLIISGLRNVGPNMSSDKMSLLVRPIKLGRCSLGFGDGLPLKGKVNDNRHHRHRNACAVEVR